MIYDKPYSIRKFANLYLQDWDKTAPPVSTPTAKGVPRPEDFLISIQFERNGKTYYFYHSRYFRPGDTVRVCETSNLEKVKAVKVEGCRRVTEKDMIVLHRRLAEHEPESVRKKISTGNTLHKMMESQLLGRRPTMIVFDDLTNEKESEVITIKEQVLVNGVAFETYSNEKLLDLIVNAEAKIKYLEGIKTESNYVKNQIAEIQGNVKKLVALMDGSNGKTEE